MNAITVVMTSMVSDLLVQILVIVAALALIVGVSVLVNYGFNKLHQVAGADESSIPYHDAGAYFTDDDGREMDFSGEYITHDD